MTAAHPNLCKEQSNVAASYWAMGDGRWGGEQNSD